MKKTTFLKSHFAKYVGMALLSLPLGMTVNAQKGGKAISPDLFGIFFEDINYAADGGLCGELIQNRSFEYSPNERPDRNPFTAWEFSRRDGSYGPISVETKEPLNANNPHYVVLNVEENGAGGLCLKNTGFESIVVKAGEKYDFSAFVRQLSEQPMAIDVKIVKQEGKKEVVLGEINFSTDSKEWKKYVSTITVNQSSDSASFLIIARSKGKIALDMVSLFPQKTFKNRPNGLRADLAQTIADLKPKFMRFPGGCLVHGNSFSTIYRWKNTIGSPEQRVAQANLWGYNQSVGLGFFEFFQFCEDIGAKPIPILPAGVTCQFTKHDGRKTGQSAVPLDQLQEYTDDVLDLIEYCNGAVTTKWGAKRAQAGHPQPFNLEYIGIGNEEQITDEFKERFIKICNVVKAKYPTIKIIGTSGPGADGKDFKDGWDLARSQNIAVVDEHYYMHPDWFIKNQKRYDKYDRKQTQKIYLGEYASKGSTLFNALSEAAYMTALERNGDIVIMSSYAPLLACDKHTQWNPDMIYFNPAKVCLTTNYYVQHLFGNNSGDTYFEGVASFKSNPNDSTFATSCVKDSKTGDIIVKLVNVAKENKSISIDLSRFKGINPNATCTILSGDSKALNTLANPTNVAPKTSDFKAAKNFTYDAPAFSLTIIRMKTKK